MNTTIRQFLDSMGGLDRVALRIGTSQLDREVEISFTSTPGTGALQVTCSGRAIMTLTPVGRPYQRQMFLVVDDIAGKMWDADDRPLHVKGPKPHDVLTLVQSA